MSKVSSHASAEQAALRKAKLASLEQEILFRSKKKALERTRLAAEQAVKNLQIEKMVAMTKAERAMFEEVSGDDNSQALSSDEDDEVIRPFKSIQIIPPQTDRLSPSEHRDNWSRCTSLSKSSARTPGDHEMMVWAEKVNETVKQSQMPKLEIKVFSGELLEFQQWLTFFEKLVEEMTSDPARHLHYLCQFTQGDANTLVAGHTLGKLTKTMKMRKKN